MGKGRSIFTSVCPGVNWTFLALCQRAGLKFHTKSSCLQVGLIAKPKLCSKQEWGKRQRAVAICGNILVLQLHYGLHSPVIVVEVDGADHFGTFEVTNLHCDFADSMAADELDNLLCGGVARVHFDRRQLNVLRDKWKTWQIQITKLKWTFSLNVFLISMAVIYREGDFWIVAHQAGVTLQIKAIKLH